MRFLSLFSGIEAASEAWIPLGWECVAFAEVDKAACQVLAARHPGVPNLGDITKITEAHIRALGRIDVVVFGSPCQDLSLAGQRKGFDGERSGLFFTANAIVRWARIHGGCRFAVWENVFGAFSSNQGRDFAAVVAEMAGLPHVDVPRHGWGNEGAAVGNLGLVEWSTLDAQWFGVAQRRRRVFAVADFGDWANRPPILLERQSLRGDSAPRRGQGQEVAGTLASRTDGGGFPGTDEACSGYVQPIAFGGNNQTGAIDVATASNACGSGSGSGRLDFETETFLVQPVTRTLQANGKAAGSATQQDAECGMLVPMAHTDTMPTLRAGASNGGAGHGARSGDSKDEYIVPVCVTGDITHTLKAEGFDASEDGTGRGQPIINSGWAVRRLMPIECERLQGFPDGHTLVKVGKKQMKDGPRYKMLGNSMAVPVMAWIGKQIDKAVAYEA